MTITRRNYGRGHGYKVDGQKVPGVTTILGAALPKPGLIGWASRVAAEFVANRVRQDGDHWIADDMVADLRTMANSSEDSRDHWGDEKAGPLLIAQAIKALPYLERDTAAMKGSDVHRLAEKLAHHEEVDVPDEYVGHVDSYIRFLDEWDPHDALVEIVIGNRTHRYCGTFDLLCQIDGLGTCLIDIKTSKGIYGETALQLVAYRHAEVYLDPSNDNAETPMPEVDFCGVVWVRADGYDLVPYEAGDREWRTFLYAYQVAMSLKGPELFGDKDSDSPEKSVKLSALRPPARKAAS